MRNKFSGFTLIEIVIVMAIITMLGGMGIIFGFDSYNRSICHTERDMLVFILYRVRSRALHNANKEPQGLHFESEKYVLFSGSSYQNNNPLNEIILPSPSISVSLSTSSASLPEDIIFSELTGNINNFSPDVSDNIFIRDSGSNCSDVISLNNEGAIEW